MSAPAIQIDHGIPVPPRKPGGRPAAGKNPVRPWIRMKPGDSIFVPGLSQSDGREIARHPMRIYGWKMETRLWTEKGVDGVRIWRKS